MSRLPHLEAQLRAAAERLTASPNDPRGRRRWGARWSLLAVGVALGSAGAAIAATGVLSSGDPVPRAPNGGLVGRAPAAQVQSRIVKSVRAADPDGGPLWAIRTTLNPGGISCASVARVQDGKLGVVGRDGVFGNDGRFHELPVDGSQSGMCGGNTPDGHVFMGGDAPPVPASGYTGAPGTRIGGCREHVPLATMSPNVRRRLRDVPVCSGDATRTVKFGFAGPYARRVTVTSGDVRRSQKVSEADSGAYLFVFRPRDLRGPLQMTVTFRDGTSCDPLAATGLEGGDAMPATCPYG